MRELELLCCIVNHGRASKVLRFAKQHGIKGGTILLGRGTVKNHLLEILDLNDERKEILITIADKDVLSSVVEDIADHFAFHKPNHGIAFTIPLKGMYGTRTPGNVALDFYSEGSQMYDAIFTIVEKGLASEVIDAANSAGARGGTILKGRGSGIHETEVLFAMPVEPEREVVLILAQSDMTEAITGAIRRETNLDAPGKGIIFVTGASKTYGLYAEKDK